MIALNGCALKLEGVVASWTYRRSHDLDLGVLTVLLQSSYSNFNHVGEGVCLFPSQPGSTIFCILEPLHHSLVL